VRHAGRLFGDPAPRRDVEFLDRFITMRCRACATSAGSDRQLRRPGNYTSHQGANDLPGIDSTRSRRSTDGYHARDQRRPGRHRPGLLRELGMPFRGEPRRGRLGDIGWEEAWMEKGQAEAEVQGAATKAQRCAAVADLRIPAVPHLFREHRAARGIPACASQFGKRRNTRDMTDPRPRHADRVRNALPGGTPGRHPVSKLRSRWRGLLRDNHYSRTSRCWTMASRAAAALPQISNDAR